MRKVFETCQVYYTILLKFIAFEFIVILKHIFCLPKKASITTFSDGLLTSLFSAIRLYYVAFLSFFYIQLFLTFFIVHVSPGSRFFRVQVFQGPSFLWSRFFRVRVQGLVPGFKSSLFLFSYKKILFGQTLKLYLYHNFIVCHDEIKVIILSNCVNLLIFLNMQHFVKSRFLISQNLV